MKQRVQLITATTGAEEAVARAKKAVSVVEEEKETTEAVLNDSGMDRSKRVLNDAKSSSSSKHGQLCCMTVAGGSGSDDTVSERIM